MVKIKKIRVGAELEFFTLDEYGKLINGGDKLIKKLKNNLDPKIVDVQPEIGKSMVELNFQPTENIEQLYNDFSGVIKSIYDISEDSGMVPYIAGTYPGKAKYTMRGKSWYRAQRKLLGKNMDTSLKVCGFHFHYTLPSGIINRNTENIRHLKYSLSKDAFLNIYNFSVAADPGLITISQSSPYFDGKYIGKDARVIVYRDFTIETENGPMSGMYSNSFSFMGGLPNYEFTLNDVKWSSDKRKDFYINNLRAIGYDIKDIFYKTPLSFMWGPLRVNKIGTLEFRGMDSSPPDYLFSSASLLSGLISKIIEDGIQTMPSDIGADEPFKLEDNIIYLPPFNHVKSIESLSALYGLGNTSVHKYVKSMFNLSKKLGVRNPLSDKLKEIIDTKITVSDKLIQLVINNADDYKRPKKEVLEFVALKYAEDLKKSL